jgi:ABC-type multidrug transport system ATPase subunit
LSMIAGLIRPTAGRIVLFGRPLAESREQLRRVGLMPVSRRPPKPIGDGACLWS